MTELNPWSVSGDIKYIEQIEKFGVKLIDN